MADESYYDTHKRKYDASPPPQRRRATGFSDGPPPSQPPAQYSSVPPPADEFAKLKQNIQQLASRALSNSNINPNPNPNPNNNGDSDYSNNNYNKRSKFDDNPPYSSNYDSYSGQKPVSSGNQYGNTPSSHGYSGSSNRTIEIPNGRVGVIIGKGGETIKYLQNESGARIQIMRDADQDPGALTRAVDLMGTEEQISKAESLIRGVIAEAEAGGPGSVSRKIPAAPGSEQFVMKVASNRVGLVIGKGGETIKNIQAQTGARVQVIPLHPPPGDMSMERTVQIDGTSEQIEHAKQMINDVTENRNRNPAMSGGYSQQGYQAQPSANWAPQSQQTQQPGAYGYMQQPAAYPNAPVPYSQQPYSGYPPQNASGYPQNWDPSGVSQTQQSSGYDYYGQQQQTQPQQPPSGPPTDNSGYSYNQPPTSAAYSQGYSQEYPGYAQAPANSQSGYAGPPAYGNPPNPQSQAETGQVPPSGQVPPASQTQQGYTAQPSPNAAYPTPGATQPSYGMPPTSQPGYAAPSSAQGGYVSGYGPHQIPPPNGQPQQSPSQVGYAQPGYSQPDGGAPRPAYGGSTVQPGMYPPYGAPPAPSYGQQPPAYYGGGYYQTPAYPTEGNGSVAPASTAVAPAATPSPAAQPTAAAKSSP